MKTHMLVALATCLGLGIAGVNLWLCLLTFGIWVACSVFTRPPKEAPRRAAPAVFATQEFAKSIIEPLGTPLLFLERTRIVVANAAARSALGGHVVGQDVRVALRHPDAVALLDGPSHANTTIRGLTTPRSVWELAIYRFDDGLSLVEMGDKTSQSDLSRAHTDFVANASHELRTPLSSIIGYVETLLEPNAKVDAETRTKFLDTIRREANRMQSLVSDLLSLSRIEAEKHDRPSDVIHLDILATSIVADMRSIEGQERIDFELESNLPRLQGDARQIDQLIRNLIDNSLKYGAPDQPVRISIAKRSDSRLLLSIEDKGPGISAEHLPHLTRRFYRTDTGRSRTEGGTGLGLAIVKHIVERHRGRLNIKSEEGQGTIVEVDFPTIPESVIKESSN